MLGELSKATLFIEVSPNVSADNKPTEVITDNLILKGSSWVRLSVCLCVRLCVRLSPFSKLL